MTLLFDGSDLTGDGWHEFGSFTAPGELLYIVTSFPPGAEVWVQPDETLTHHGVRRLFHAGEIMFGWGAEDDAGAGDTPWVCWSTYIDFDHFDGPVTGLSGYVADVFWHLRPGVTIDLKVWT